MILNRPFIISSIELITFSECCDLISWRKPDAKASSHITGSDIVRVQWFMKERCLNVLINQFISQVGFKVKIHFLQPFSRRGWVSDSHWKSFFFFLLCFSTRNDEDVKDDWGAAAGADPPRTQTDARQLHEHHQGAAARSHLRCIWVNLCGQTTVQAAEHPAVVIATMVITVISCLGYESDNRPQVPQIQSIILYIKNILKRGIN